MSICAVKDGRQRFWVCKHCGNLIGLIDNKGVPLVCCGEQMTELVPNTTEAATEKHLPAVTVSESFKCACGCDCKCISVEVGSVPHPMEEAHQITFIYLETEKGGQRKKLEAGDEPKACFCVCDDELKAVYAYCNLHGLWKTEV